MGCITKTGTSTYDKYGGNNVRKERLIENEINEKLTGDTLKDTLDFVAFMQENGFSFEWWENGNETGWTPVYDGETLGTIVIASPTYFMLWLGLMFDFKNSGMIDDDLREFAWAHVAVCPQENYCKPPYCEHSKNPFQIFGNEYESACHYPLIIHDSDAKSFENVKKLLQIYKQNKIDMQHPE